MTRRTRFCRWLAAILACSVILAIGFSWLWIDRTIPDRLSVIVEEEEFFRFPIPLKATLLDESQEVILSNGSNIPAGELRLQGNEAFSVYSKNQGSYRLSLKLFGWLDFKEVQLDVVDSQYAIPCGAPIGIYLKSKGVMVIGTGKLQDETGTVVEPAFGVLQSGDYIEAINGNPLQDKEALISQVNQNGEEEAVLSVRRNGEVIQVAVSPTATSDGDYKLGAWVRDDTQGIGTITYVDMNGNFGALGHGISDSDTGAVVEISGGELYETEILGIDKGSLGKPGVMSGIIYYGGSSRLGEIKANTEEGIFGTVNEKYRKSLDSDPVEIGYRQDVKKGPAVIRSNVSGESKDYTIEIQKIDDSSARKNKSLIIKVTDPQLLNLTGGIVQGMSGSPILQDGKLIGAVTHVFVQDPTRGYGILIENMMKIQQEN